MRCHLHLTTFWQNSQALQVSHSNYISRYFAPWQRLQQLAAFTTSSSDYLQNGATGLNKQVTRKEPDTWPSWGRFAQLQQHKAVTKPAQTAVGGFPWRKRIPEWQRATKATPTQSHSLVPRNPWQLGRHNGARSTCYHSERPKGCSIGQWMAKGAPSIFGSPFASTQRPAFITSHPQPEVHRGNVCSSTATAEAETQALHVWLWFLTSVCVEMGSEGRRKPGALHGEASWKQKQVSQPSQYGPTGPTSDVSPLLEICSCLLWKQIL